MPVKLTYAIKFVKDMGNAVRFYRDTLGLKLKFESPDWTEFDTGDTILALHIASNVNQAGSVELGLGVADIDAFCAGLKSRGVKITREPETIHGAKLAEFLDCEGAKCSLGE